MPADFIVRPYVPQSAILKHAASAITHAGMDSVSDLLATAKKARGLARRLTT